MNKEFSATFETANCDHNTLKMLNTYNYYNETFYFTVVTKKKVWEFPPNRFIIYEESDEKWCRPLGIGQEIEVKETMEIPHAYVESMNEDEIILKGIPNEF
uniref:Uncharacterized protein n=1 Tax=viral metagenome TaxID=1070528 RepID=A0A6M3IMC2_9ZZZZ